MAQVEVRLLGTLTVLIDGEERVIASRKGRALVALLALRPGARTRDSLVAELWPESDDERGRQSLRHALYEINAAVHELIAATPESLRIADGVAVDVRELETAVASATDDDLVRAIAIYRGDLCAEIEGVDGEAERVRLRGLFAGAGEALAARRLEKDPPQAERIARRTIEIDPYREEAHRLLLRALAAQGDLAGAAVHYKRLTALLRDELGVEPSAETKRLYGALGRSAAPAVARIRRPSLEPPAELIGRRAEYAALMGLVTAAIDGRGGAALLTGEAGAGKSRLLDEIASVAERHGLRVLRASATSAEGALPFQTWIDALAPVASEVAALPAPWPAVLATILPDAARGQAGDVAPELRRTRLFEAVARLLAHVSASAPLVVALDDIHQADDDSAQLFHYVARTLRGRRVAVVAASRPTAVGTSLDTARASLEARGQLLVIPLGPLAQDAVGELLERFGVGADAPWLAPRVSAWTGGNPFFVFEVLRALVDRGHLAREGDRWTWSGSRPGEDEPLAPELPSTVRQTILTRVGALPDPTRRVLELLAVAGPPVRLEMLAAVAGRDELSLAEDLGPALAAGLLRETDGADGAIAFAHDLVADATYQRVPHTVRAAIHRRVASVLERGGGSSRAIAYHLAAGGETARAVEHWLLSARAAEATYAHDDAIRALRSALDALGPSPSRRADVLTRLGDAHLRRGTAAEAVAAYDEALNALAPAAEDERASLQSRIANAARFYQRHPKAHEYAEAAVAHYRARGDRARLADALVGLAFVRYVDGDGAAARAAGEEARAIARDIGDVHVEIRALHVVIWARWLGGEGSAVPDLGDAERLIGALGDSDGVAVLLGMVSVARQRAGDLAGATAWARRALAVARRVGSLRGQLEAGEQLVVALRVGGAFDEAIAIADEIREDTRGLEFSEPPQLEAELVLALAASANTDRAVAVADDIVARTPERAASHIMPSSVAIGALRTAGRMDHAERLARERPSCRSCERNWLVIAGRDAALRGDADRALALADELAALTESQQPGGLPHIRALAHAARGDGPAAEREAAAARDAYRKTGREDALVILERDLARLSAVHA